MKARQIIEDAISRTVGAMLPSGVKLPGFVLEHPADESRGDWATNVAMILAKELKTSPRELAEKIMEKLQKSEVLGGAVDLDRIEVAGPGFINFWLKDDYLVERLEELKDSADKYGDADFMKGRKVLVEYSSPNIAKRFSVGHLRSTIVGQALFNFYKHSGAEVTNDNHLGDWGTQFGMIIAAVEEEDLDITKMDVAGLEDLYVKFNKRVDEDPKVKEKAREAFARLEQGEARAREIWQKAGDVSMVEFRQIYQKLGVPDFEHEYGESAYEKIMPEVIGEMKEKGVAIESEGAWIVKYLDRDGKECMPPARLNTSTPSASGWTVTTIRRSTRQPPAVSPPPRTKATPVSTSAITKTRAP